MDKSLLELLEEKRVVQEIILYKKSSYELLSHAENKDEGYNVDACYCISSDYEKKFKESEDKLIIIRKEIKQYLFFLMDLTTQ